MAIKKSGIKEITNRVRRLLIGMRKKRSFSLDRVDDASRAFLLDESLRSLCRSRNDPRCRLEVLRMLPPHIVYFLTSPRRKHDPLMVFPQVFYFRKKVKPEDSPIPQFQHISRRDYETLKKLNQVPIMENVLELGVPIFTELRYLREFCARYRFSVYGPDGDNWAPDSAKNQVNALRPPWTERCMDYKATEKQSPPSHQREIYDDVVPIYLFETPVNSSFTGCFGEFSKVIDHLANLPSMVSLFLNPSTEIQWKMSLNRAHAIGHNESIGSKLYKEIAEKISTELYKFFKQFCPEVLESYYWVHPKSLQANDEYSSHNFTILVGVTSEDFSATKAMLRTGRESLAWLGHPSVEIKSSYDFPSSWINVATVFYVRDPTRIAEKIGSFESFSMVENWNPPYF